MVLLLEYSTGVEQRNKRFTTDSNAIRYKANIGFNQQLASCLLASRRALHLGKRIANGDAFLGKNIEFESSTICVEENSTYI
jgi:hypothetical protein